MSRRHVIGAFAGALALGVAGSAAYARVSGSGGTINACYAPGGFLRVVPTERCHWGETALTWNQQGVPGPSGPAGPAGPAASLATTTVSAEIVNVAPRGVGQSVAHCPSSTTAISGGFFVDGFDNTAPLVVTASELVNNGSLVGFFNPSSVVTATANAIVYCAPSS